jgi:hypothetical protein
MNVSTSSRMSESLNTVPSLDASIKRSKNARRRRSVKNNIIKIPSRFSVNHVKMSSLLGDVKASSVFWESSTMSGVCLLFCWCSNFRSRITYANIRFKVFEIIICIKGRYFVGESVQNICIKKCIVSAILI